MRPFRLLCFFWFMLVLLGGFAFAQDQLGPDFQQDQDKNKDQQFRAPDHPCDAQSPKGDLCWCKISQLHPTQITVGLVQVGEKREEITELLDEGHDILKFEEKDPEPTVIGPQGILYIIDHHHLARALADEKVETTCCLIVDNRAGMDPEKFELFLSKQKWIYPYNDVKDPHHLNPIPLEDKDFPKRVMDLRDDPYRSLAGLVRRADPPGFDKSDEPFAEFAWANFFRSRIKLKSDMGHHDWKKKISKAVKLAKSKKARGLPGYRGK